MTTILSKKITTPGRPDIEISLLQIERNKRWTLRKTIFHSVYSTRSKDLEAFDNLRKAIDAYEKEMRSTEASSLTLGEPTRLLSILFTFRGKEFQLQFKEESPTTYAIVSTNGYKEVWYWLIAGSCWKCYRQILTNDWPLQVREAIQSKVQEYLV